MLDLSSAADPTSWAKGPRMVQHMRLKQSPPIICSIIEIFLRMYMSSSSPHIQTRRTLNAPQTAIYIYKNSLTPSHVYHIQFSSPSSSSRSVPLVDRSMSIASHHQAIFGLSLCLLYLLPLALGECTCDEESLHRDNSTSRKYKIGAIVSILVAGAVGVCIPMLGKVVPALRPERDVFFIVKAFAAGVILATGFIHVFPEAYERLTSPCLTGKAWESFPFAGFVTMVAAIVTLQIDMFATSYYTRRHLIKDTAKEANSEDKEAAGGAHAEHHHHHAHAHPLDTSTSSSDLIRHRVISQVRNYGPTREISAFKDFV